MDHKGNAPGAGGEPVPQPHKVVTLDGRAVTLDEVNQVRASLPAGKRLVEVSPGQYRVLSRIHG